VKIIDVVPNLSPAHNFPMTMIRLSVRNSMPPACSCLSADDIAIELFYKSREQPNEGNRLVSKLWHLLMHDPRCPVARTNIATPVMRARVFVIAIACRSHNNASLFRRRGQKQLSPHCPVLSFPSASNSVLCFCYDPRSKRGIFQKANGGLKLS
jgi:hypothetical protein